jgi:putative acetyltransferase
VRIRAYEARDAADIAALYRRSVETLGLRDYSPDQVAAWASRTPDAAAFHARLSDGRAVFVWVDDADRPQAFADLEADGHIDFLYCAPEIVGTGAAAELYAAVEALARQRGMTRLHSEASEAALRFFLKRGFVKLHRRDLMIGETPIHNYAVEKSLA